jgi:3-deoxy-D-manno-octulosonic-acid transferase
MTLFGFVYDLCLHLYVCACLPKMIIRLHKYRNTLWSRLGRHFPHINKKGRALIWVHAVSVGETKAVAPLIKRIKALKNPPLVLLSATTETGHAEGLRSAPMADFHLYLPFDFSYVIRPIVNRVAPDMVILTETDFWYHFQDAAKKKGAQLVLINGKISQRSFKRLSKFPLLARRLFNQIDHFYVQGELYQTRFAQLDVPSSKLTVTGNLKLDSEIDVHDAATVKRELGLSNQTVLTLGSTHDPEEKMWIKALKELWPHFPHLKVLVVPRHPERFNEVARLLESESLSFTRWSQGGTVHMCPVLLVDTMGVLRKCYQISDIAFVGGSLTAKVGGHNILEPAFYGKPVLFGPHMHAQPDLLDLVRTHRAGLQIAASDIGSTLRRLLTQPALCEELGSNGLKLIGASRGALDATWTPLLCLLQKRPSC